MISKARIEELIHILNENTNPGEGVFIVDGSLVIYHDQAPPAWALAARYAGPIDPHSQAYDEALAEDAKREVDAQLIAEGIAPPEALA